MVGRFVAWALGLSGIALVLLIIAVVAFWHYLALAGLWWLIARRARNLERRLH